MAQHETADCVVCGRDTYDWKTHESADGQVLLGLIGLVATVVDNTITDHINGTHLGHFYFCSWEHVRDYAEMVIGLGGVIATEE